MKTFINIFTMLFLLMLFSQTAYDQKKPQSEVNKIETYVKKLDVETKKPPALVFADISQNDQPKWRKFASSKTLEKFREQRETYSISNNWLLNKKIVVSVFTIFSESGDWANYVYYYFRQDGTLAKIESEYRTFYGDFATIKDIFFDSKGKIIKQTVKYVDLDNKPIEPDKQYLKENSPMMNDFGYYKTINKLPFYHLLK